ncbi:Agamous-like MADS-box protein AGL29 [Linum perenne]
MTLAKDKRRRQVSLSKRRTSLFKKTRELATLYAGVQFAIFLFPHGRKPFSFANFDFSKPRMAARTNNKNNNMRNDIERMNEEYDLLKRQINTEKQISVVLEEILKKGCSGSWFMELISKMGMTELLGVKKWLVKFKREIKERDMEMEASSALLLLSEQRPKMEEEINKASSSNCND